MLRLVTLLLCLTATLAVVPHGKLPLAGQRNLMEFMVKSRAASQENPARSLSCFDYYVPILNDITAEYEQNYGVCISNAQEGFSKIDGQTKPQRYEIEENAKAACGALVTCAGYENSIDYFSCFNVEGAYNSKTMYNISADSADILINVREQYRLVETEQLRCSNEAERAYVENTGSTYDELQACLQGKAPVPTTAAPPTTFPPITSQSTQEDTTFEPTTTTTEIWGTTIQAMNENNDGIDNKKSRVLLDGKWREILGKFQRHFY